MKSNRLISILIKILLVCLIILAVGFALSNSSFRELLENPKQMKQYVISFGYLAPVIFIIIYTLRTLLLIFPVAIFAIVSSSLFGFWEGLLFSMIGATLSASVAFSIGRYLARDLVNKYLSGRVHLLRERKVNGFKIILFLRLLMIMPFDAFSYAVGASKIRYHDFILGTIIGIIPEFVAYSYLGYIGFNSDFTIKQKIIFSLVVIIFIICMHFSKQYVERHIKKGE